MTWTARSLIAFAVGLFATTVFAEGLYHLIGTPGCQSTVTTPVRCSEESGWWALVVGGGLVVALTSMRAARGNVARILLGGLLLGGGTAPLWAVLD
nr:hypothetical protein [Actinomycetota bacterium]